MKHTFKAASRKLNLLTLLAIGTCASLGQDANFDLKGEPTDTTDYEISWISHSITHNEPYLHYECQLEMSTDLASWRSVGDRLPGGVRASASIPHTVRVPAADSRQFYRLSYRLNAMGIDLSGMDLTGLNLRGADLRSTNLENAILTDADLSHALIAGASLKDAELANTNFNEVELNGLNLDGVDLSAIRGVPVLTQISGTHFPDLTYHPLLGNYSNEDPDIPGAGISKRNAMVMLKAGVSTQQLNSLLEQENGKIVGCLPPGTSFPNAVLMVQFETESVRELFTLTERLSEDALIETTAPDVLQRTNIITDDEAGATAERMTWRWGPDVDPPHGNWGLEFSRVPQMWNWMSAIEKLGAPRIGTLVVDGGYQDHLDIFFSSRRGRNPDKDPDHALHVAGIIGAADDSVGIDGVNPFSDLRVLGALHSTFTTIEDLKRALQSSNNDARIINMSYGWSWSCDKRHVCGHELSAFGLILAEQTARAWGPVFQRIATSHSDKLFVSAAGNDYRVIDTAITSEANYAALRLNTPNIIVVESHDQGIGSAFSNINGHVAAPGSNILSTVSGNRYAVERGTSMAAPFVSGLAGFLLALDSQLTPIELKQLLRPDPSKKNVDAFASVMELDVLRGTRDRMRMLLDIDDGTPDGNERLETPDAMQNKSRAFDRITSAPVNDIDEEGNGKVDMADFRRWRDWMYLGGGSHQLNGDERNLKNDANGDGKVDDREASVFPRADFNGDGMLHATSPKPVPGWFNGEALSDLEVLIQSGVWSDPVYDDPEELLELVDSVDVAVSAFNLFEGDSDVSSIAIVPFDHVTEAPYGRWAARRLEFDAGEPEELQILTLPAGESYYLSTEEPVEIGAGRKISVKSPGKPLEVSSKDRGADYVVDLVRQEMTAISEIVNPNKRQIDSQPDAKEVSTSIEAHNDFERVYKDEIVTKNARPGGGAHAFANEDASLYAQVRSGAFLSGSTNPNDPTTDTSYIAKVHWRRSFVKNGDYDDPTFSIDPVLLIVHGWGRDGRDLKASAEIKIEIRAYDRTPVWQPVSHVYNEIAGRRTGSGPNAHTFKLVDRIADPDTPPEIKSLVMDGEGFIAYRLMQPAYKGVISLDGIPNGHSFEIRYTLEARITAPADNYAEAFIGDPFDYGSGLRMAYGDFGELPIIESYSNDGVGVSITFQSKEDYYYAIYRRGELIGVKMDGGSASSQFVDPDPPIDVVESDYVLENQRFDQPADLDGDGIDDLYEWSHASILDPLDPLDALLDPDGDGRSTLEEYRQRTDPAVADAPPTNNTPSSNGLYPGELFDAGMVVRWTGDLTADGVPDLLGYVEGHVQVARGVAGSGFEPAVTSPLPDNAFVSHQRLLDVNGDELPDLIIVDELASCLNVLLGDGQGRFTDQDCYPLGNGSNRLNHADVNGDGLTDFLTSNRTGRSVSTLLGRGDGTFEQAVESPLLITPTDVAAARMDADLHADLIVTLLNNQVAILRGDGTGAFTNEQRFHTGPNCSRVAILDLDGDQHHDVITFGGHNVTTLLGQGDGTLANRADHATGEALSDLALAQFNDDSDIDLIIADAGAPYHSILTNNGDGSFTIEERVPTASDPTSLIADFGGDGLSDILSRSGGTSYFINRGLGEGHFETRIEVAIPNLSAGSLGLADFNGDGGTEFVILNKNANTFEIVSNSDGNAFSHSQTLPIEATKVVSMVTGRFDSDGHADLAFITQVPLFRPDELDRNQLHLWLGDGTGGFEAQSPINLTDTPSGLQTADLNNDGTHDLLIYYPVPRAFEPRYNNGAGQFTAQTLQSADDGGYLPDLDGGLHHVPSNAFTVGGMLHDMTGDGILDVVRTTYNGTDLNLIYTIGNGDGIFGTDVVLIEGFQGSGLVQLADLNGDSHIDITSGPLVQLADPNGGYEEPRFYWGTPLVVQDVNGDGKPDRIGLSNAALEVVLQR